MQEKDNELSLATVLAAMLRQGKGFSSYWPVLVLPEDILGPNPEVWVAFWSFIFKRDDKAPCRPRVCFFSSVSLSSAVPQHSRREITQL